MEKPILHNTNKEYSQIDTTIEEEISILSQKSDIRRDSELLIWKEIFDSKQIDPKAIFYFNKKEKRLEIDSVLIEEFELKNDESKFADLAEDFNKKRIDSIKNKKKIGLVYPKDIQNDGYGSFNEPIEVKEFAEMSYPWDKYGVYRYSFDNSKSSLIPISTENKFGIPIVIYHSYGFITKTNYCYYIDPVDGKKKVGTAIKYGTRGKLKWQDSKLIESLNEERIFIVPEKTRVFIVLLGDLLTIDKENRVLPGREAKYYPCYGEW